MAQEPVRYFQGARLQLRSAFETDLILNAVDCAALGTGFVFVGDCPRLYRDIAPCGFHPVLPSLKLPASADRIHPNKLREPGNAFYPIVFFFVFFIFRHEFFPRVILEQERREFNLEDVRMLICFKNKAMLAQTDSSKGGTRLKESGDASKPQPRQRIDRLVTLVNAAGPGGIFKRNYWLSASIVGLHASLFCLQAAQDISAIGPA